MKRILNLLLILALLLSVSVSAVSADELKSATQEVTEYIYLSPDLMTVTREKQTYVRFNDDQLSGYFKWTDDQLVLPDELEDQIKSWAVSSFDGIAYLVELEYYDGVSMQISYIRQDLQEKYQYLLTCKTVTVDFREPEDNVLELTLDYEKMEEDVFFEDDISGMITFDVTTEGDGMKVERGQIIEKNDQFYYFDYAENKTTYIYDLKTAKVWHITDQAMYDQCKQASDAYFDEGLGFMEEEEFSLNFTVAFLAVMFGAMPVIILVLFLVLAIRAKKPVYRNMFWNLCAWSGVLLVFVSLVIALGLFAG